MSRAVGHDRTRRPRGHSRILEAYGDVLSSGLSSAFEGNREKERISIGHKRRVEEIDSDVAKLDRNAVRERNDIARGIENTESQIRSENQRLALLRTRQEGLVREGKPTEVIDEQIVNANRHASELWNTKVSLTQRQHRLEEDLKSELAEKRKEKQQEQEDVRRRLKEAN